MERKIEILVYRIEVFDLEIPLAVHVSLTVRLYVNYRARTTPLVDPFCFVRERTKAKSEKRVYNFLNHPTSCVLSKR